MKYLHVSRERVETTARRLREGVSPRPLVERETRKLPGDLVIFATRTEMV